LLFFLWLFALSGLLLNHPQWESEFLTKRRQSTLVRRIETPSSGVDLERAHDLMHQLDIQGEVEWTTAQADPNRFDFRVSRPGHILEIKTDLARRTATIERSDLNGWGIAHVLHTFTGVRAGDARNYRDWILTSVWVIAMDAVAVGLIFMVFSSLVLWYRQSQKRRLGLVFLVIGLASCTLFCTGLRWLY
jgi:hypothetical protein